MNSSRIPNPSLMDSRLVAVKKEFISEPMNEETHKMEQLLPKSMERHVEKEKAQLPVELGAAESAEDDIPILTGKPFFDVVLAKSHVNPTYHFQLPVRIVRELPRTTIPVVLSYNRKNWDMDYIGYSTNPRFDPRWRKFVDDNDLKIGDACVFELMEHSATIIKLKVHILRGELPPELQAVVNTRGSVENPIELD